MIINCEKSILKLDITIKNLYEIIKHTEFNILCPLSYCLNNSFKAIQKDKGFLNVLVYFSYVVQLSSIVSVREIIYTVCLTMYLIFIPI